MSPTDQDFILRRTSFAELKGWRDDDPSSLFETMRACYRHNTNEKPYRSGSLGLTADDLNALLSDAMDISPADANDARAFFETRCQPFLIIPKGETGFVTAFYEPEIEVSSHRDQTYRFPFYRRPDDLVDLDESNRPEGMDPDYVFGLAGDDGIGIGPYADRRSIDQGYLDGRNLEIAWAKSKVDVFFVHVQGAARLRYTDGRRGRITYAAKAGHRFSPIGKLLIDLGEISAADISMQSIRAWLASHSKRVYEILWHNRSYIFFREQPAEDQSAGPIAAAKVPLIAGRSLAVDRLIHTFGFPFFIRSESLTHLDDGQPFQRLMLALDTGSAIVGPARGDIFTGSGDDAGESAGTVRNQADVYLLVPNHAAARFSQ